VNDEVQGVHFVADPSEYNDLDHEASLADFISVLEEGKLLALLAESDGVATGYLMAEETRRPANPFKSATNLLYVHHVGVNPELRRMRIGTVLFEESVRIALDGGLSRVLLDTRTFNNSAQDFFRALGFELNGVRMIRRLERCSRPFSNNRNRLPAIRSIAWQE
jgi:ribosomal protein S18 acetylase RimI-like enzyme